MRVAAALARKEARDVLRERTIVVALVLQAFLAAFSTFLTVGLLGLYDPSSLHARLDADVAYVGPGGFDEHLRDAGNLRVARMGLEDAVAAFRAGGVEMVVEEVALDPQGERTVSLLVAQGSLQGTLVLTQAQGLLEQYERSLREGRQGRLETQVLYVDQPGRAPAVPYAFLHGTLLPILVVTPVFLSGAIAGDSLLHEARTRTLLVLRSVPASTGELLAGKLAVPILAAPLQVLAWVGLLRLNGVQVQGLGALLGLTAILTLLVCGVGVTVAAWVRSETANQAAYAVGALTLAALALQLPRDPFNLVALLSSGGMDAAAWRTFVALGAAAVAAAGVATWSLRRALRGDRL